MVARRAALGGVGCARIPTDTTAHDALIAAEIVLTVDGLSQSAAHQARGTFRRDRHSHLTTTPIVGAVAPPLHPASTRHYGRPGAARIAVFAVGRIWALECREPTVRLPGWVARARVGAVSAILTTAAA